MYLRIIIRKYVAIEVYCKSTGESHFTLERKKLELTAMPKYYVFQVKVDICSEKKPHLTKDNFLKSRLRPQRRVSRTVLE